MNPKKDCFYYQVENGIVSVEVGKQNFKYMTVEVTGLDGNIEICTMHKDEDGDYFFIYEGEAVYFHHNIRM